MFLKEESFSMELTSFETSVVEISIVKMKSPQPVHVSFLVDADVVLSIDVSEETKTRRHCVY